ncbi:MAG: hypothetical protein AVDCRST_MAG18-1445 [uncultured Thermomicrobiales bacterium]|uniref:Uncharacterized protein n=1 Tax=uncultured Thermomicrobiales bacterium TaxID=1645740 RepID=A0A6J4V384_9BACT|nr:MAG: hypothetical protein AVDCRST_MAG18-1445 [uncultured Thermomicrobiales bacterium]
MHTLGLRHHPRDEIPTATLESQLCGVEQPPSLARPIFAQLDRPFECVYRHADRAPPPRPPGRSLERRGHALVGPDERRRPVPDLPVGLVREHRRERRVGRVALGEAGRLVDRRAHERVAEGDPCAGDLDESDVDGRHEALGRLLSVVDRPRGGDDLAQYAAIVYRREQQQRARVRRQPGGLDGERLLQTLGQRQRRGKSGTAAALVCSQHHRQLDQREWVASSLRQQSFAHRRRELSMVRVEQLSGRRVMNAAEPQRGEPSVVYGALLVLAARREQGDRLVLDAPGDEGQDVGARAVQPLGVLGDDQQRRPLGDVGDQLEQGERDEESIGDLSLDHAEGGQ